MLDADGFVLLEKSTVRLKPYVPRTFKPFELMSEQELLEGAGGTLIVDTETYINYHLIAFKNIRTNKVLLLELPFNPRMLSWIMHSYTTVGFNSNKYDLAIIWLAYATMDLEKIKAASDALIFQGIFPAELAKEYGFIIHPTPHIDLIEVCPLTGSLKLYAARLHAPRIQDLPLSVHKPISEEEKLIVANYCVNDLDSTQIIYENLSEQLTLRHNLSREYGIDLMSKSDAQIAEAVIGHELQKLKGKWPSKPKIRPGTRYSYKVPSFVFFQTEQLQTVLKTVSTAEYEVLESGRVIIPKEIETLNIKIGNTVYRMGNGGLHSSEKNAVVKVNGPYKLYDKDVASYYPAIVLRLGIYPEQLGPEFLQVYSTIKDRRLAAKGLIKQHKKQGNKAEENRQTIISEGLKITINGTFGKMGSPYSILYAPELLTQVTLTGQLCLLMLIEMLELYGISVVSANTDGIVIYCHDDKKEAMDNIVKKWEQLTQFETEETKYAALYSRDVNAYLAVKEADADGKVSAKGKNLYYDPWSAKTARDLIWRFFKNPNTQICTEAVERLITEGYPIAQTIKECRDIRRFVAVKNVKGGGHKDGHYLGKVVRWYYAKGVFGTINYISNDNKVADTDGAKPCMDLPETFPDDIDYDWYIRKATEMLYDLGYYERPKQITFF